MFGKKKEPSAETSRRGFLRKLPLAAGVAAVAVYQEKKSSINQRSEKMDAFFKDKIKPTHLKTITLQKDAVGPRGTAHKPREVASEPREAVFKPREAASKPREAVSRQG